MTSFDLTLYLVTDRRMPKEGFETVVEEAIRGGVTLVQLREKEGDTGLLYERARRLKEVTDRYHIPLIMMTASTSCWRWMQQASMWDRAICRRPSQGR